MNELNSYESLRDVLVYEGAQEINGRLCYRYHALIDHLSGETEETYWIEQETGICMKHIEDYRSSLYASKRTVILTVYETENCFLPER